MSRPKLQSLTMTTVRCLLALCVLGLLLGFQVNAQRRSRKLSFEATRADRDHATVVRTGGVYFRIRGRVTGLFPGAVRPLKIKISNPNRFPIRVRSLRVQVKSSNRAGCGPRWIRPRRRVKLKLLVPAKRRSFVSYPVRMRGRAPEACDGARWALRFTGRGDRP